MYYGTRWAQAATAPSRLYKSFATEGGCRVPLVLKEAKSINQQQGRPAISDTFCTVLDLVPTLLAQAGISHPGSQYKGRTIHPLDCSGRSWVDFLASPSTAAFAIHPETSAHGWEVAGSAGLRRGRFKITFVPRPKGPQKWQLYDILDDPGEVSDLRETKLELFEELHGLWLDYKQRVGVVGVAGEYDRWQKPPPGLTDEFEDDGKWVRFIGKEALPGRFN